MVKKSEQKGAIAFRAGGQKSAQRDQQPQSHQWIDSGVGRSASKSKVLVPWSR